MAQRTPMAVYHAVEMSNKKKEKWEGPSINMAIEDNYCINTQASLQLNERISFPRGEGEDSGLYKGGGVWLMAVPSVKPDIKRKPASTTTIRAQIQKPSHITPLQTSNPISGRIHDNPKPFPAKGRPVDIHFKFSGSGVPEVRDIVLKQQSVEFPRKERSLIKHFLGGRISFQMVQLEWEGPFISIMSDESKQKYIDSFQSIDADRSASINQDELLKIFQKHKYPFTAKDVAKLVQRYSGTVKGQVTFDEYCEMMEAEGCAGRAWFITSIRAVITEGGFEQVLISSDDLLFGKIGPLFQDCFVSRDLEQRGMLTADQISQIFDVGCKRIGLQSSSVLEAVGGLSFDVAMSHDEFMGLIGAEPFRSTLTAMYRARFKMVNAERSKELIEFRARAKLIRVKGTFVRVTTQLVVCSYTSLNSGDVFLLDCGSRVYAWFGKEANEFETLRAQEMASELSTQREEKCEVIHVDDGSEPADFWFILGGKGPVAEAGAGMSDEVAEGLRDPTMPYPSPRKDKPRCAVIGSGVSGSVCAREIMKNSGIEVVVFESSGSVGGRLGSVVRNGVSFSAGASYFCAAGPHMTRHLQELIESGVVSQWNPRVGILTSFSTGTVVSAGFIPALHTIESEVNVEAWLEARPKTGSKRHPKASLRPATAFRDPLENVPLYDLPPPNLLHRRSHAQSFAHGHGSQNWYICKPDMGQLSAFFLEKITVHLDTRVQAIIPKLGQGVYEIVLEVVDSHELRSAGLFDFVLVCTPPNEVNRLLRDVQPSLAKIGSGVTMMPVWVVLVAFDHPVPAAYDVYLCEDVEAFDPIQAIFRESSRLSCQNPGKSFSDSDRLNMIQDRVWERPRRIGPMWGWGQQSQIHRQAPSSTVHGAPVDSWVIHLNSNWSSAHCHDFADEVAELAISKFLSIIGLENAKFRVVVSEAVLWEHGSLSEPASVDSMKPGADLSFGPYCIFDPATGIGMAGDWCVEGSVEGAFVSGLELAARVCKSPIMYHQGVSNPFGRVQFEQFRALHHRAREVAGVEVITGYSSDSRASTCFDSADIDLLDWDDRARLRSLQTNHANAANGRSIEFVRKTIQCGNEGCDRWIAVEEEAQHAVVCSFRPCAKCPFLECGEWVENLEVHLSTCKVTKVECEWCFQMVPSPTMLKHQQQCIARPTRIQTPTSQTSVKKFRVAAQILPSIAGAFRDEGAGFDQIIVPTANRLASPVNKAGQVTFQGLQHLSLSQPAPSSKDLRSIQSRESAQSRARTQEKQDIKAV